MTKKTDKKEFDFKTLNLYKVSGRDVEAEENGAWFAYTYEDENGNSITHPDIMFKIRSLGSEAGTKYQSLSAKYKKDAKSRTTKDLDTKTESALAIKALIDSGVICDWKGVRPEGGEDLSFDYAEEILTNFAFDYAASFIIQTALKPNLFREAGKEAATKN